MSKIANLEQAGFPDERRYVFAFGGIGSQFGGVFQRAEGEYFGIQSVRIGRRLYIAQVINIEVFISGNQLINQLWIDQGAITGNADHGVRLVRIRRLVIAVQNIVLAAPKNLETQATHMVNER